MAYYESWKVIHADLKSNWIIIKYKVVGGEKEKDLTLMNSLLAKNGINPSNIGARTELMVEGKGVSEIKSSNMIKKIQIIR